MTQHIAFNLVGGLGLFFLGMRMMSDSLKKVAGNRLRNTLDVLTRNPVLGLFVGTVATMLVQSSSVTTVMTVGFVNAGLLTLRQAISIVLGANIGTTFTAWLVSFFALFRVTNYALPAIGVGFLLTMFGKTHGMRMWGNFILGFGLLFTGLSLIKDAFVPLQESEALKKSLLTFGTYPVLGILLGIFMTSLLQSSSATIALLQIMAFSGLVDFRTCIPIVLGDNIGTTVTAQLASIGTNAAARRTAMAHTLLNIIGVCYMSIPVYTGVYAKFIEMLVPGPVTHNNIMLHIALSHSVFNVINSFFIFLPLTGLLERLTIKLTPVKPGELDMMPIYLERHLLNNPPIALAQSAREIIRMMDCARDALSDALKGFFNNNQNILDEVNRKEDVVDNLQREITQYLVELSQRQLEKDEAETIPVLLHSINDVERVGDHAVNLAELALRKITQKLPFEQEELDELRKIVDIVFSMFENTKRALKNNNNDFARMALEGEASLNEMQVLLKENHVNRVNDGRYNLLSGIIFIDFVDNIEKIGDHLTNIAQGVLRHLRWDFEL
ncbi:MAG: Na/Pi cotransporter family protein [Spirochaetota bacterium]